MNREEFLANVSDNFQVFTGPPRAYFDFEIASGIEKHVVYYTWSVIGKSEEQLYELATSSFLEARKSVNTDFDRKPQNPILFWRTLPEVTSADFEPGFLQLYFRVGFWDPAVEKRFLRGPYIKKEGAPAVFTS